MAEHKHAEVLRAIADGKDVQWQDLSIGRWNDPTPQMNPIGDAHLNWRVKPERKPDLVWYASVYDKHIGNTTSVKEMAWRWKSECRGVIVITFDGETGELKVKVLK